MEHQPQSVDVTLPLTSDSRAKKSAQAATENDDIVIFKGQNYHRVFKESVRSRAPFTDPLFPPAQRSIYGDGSIRPPTMFNPFAAPELNASIPPAFASAEAYRSSILFPTIRHQNTGLVTPPAPVVHETETIQWVRTGHLNLSPRLNAHSIGVHDIQTGDFDAFFSAPAPPPPLVAGVSVPQEPKPTFNPFREALRIIVGIWPEWIEKMVPKIEKQDWTGAWVSQIGAGPVRMERSSKPDETWRRVDCHPSVFRFRLYQFGKLHEVVVDDYIPVVKGAYLFCYSSQPRVYWINLLEKAYAKLCGGYLPMLMNKTVQEILVDLTNSVPELIATSEVTSATLPTMYNLLSMALEHKSRIACVTTEDLESIYQVIDVKYLITDAKKGHMVKLRDLTWSFKNSTPNLSCSGDSVWSQKGETWVPLQGFVQTFNALSILHVFDDSFLSLRKATPGKIFNGQWLKAERTAGGSFCEHAWKDVISDVPQYLIDMPEGGDILALLSQKSTEFVAEAGLAVIRVEENRKYRIQSNDFPVGAGTCLNQTDLDIPPPLSQMHPRDSIVARVPYEIVYVSEYSNTPVQFHRITVQPGRYVAIPSTYWQGTESVYRFQVGTWAHEPSSSTNLVEINTGTGRKVEITQLKDRDDSDLKWFGGVPTILQAMVDKIQWMATVKDNGVQLWDNRLSVEGQSDFSMANFFGRRVQICVKVSETRKQKPRFWQTSSKKVKSWKYWTRVVQAKYNNKNEAPGVHAAVKEEFLFTLLESDTANIEVQVFELKKKFFGIDKQLVAVAKVDLSDASQHIGTSWTKLKPLELVKRRESVADKNAIEPDEIDYTKASVFLQFSARKKI